MRVIIVGTIWTGHREQREHYYAGAGNSFWILLHRSGLTPVELTAEQDHLLPQYGIGLTDLVSMRPNVREGPPEFDLRRLDRVLRRTRPEVVAFVSKTAAAAYARVSGARAPKGYGELSWTAAGRPAFVVPGPSGANNGMHLPLRIALWRDLADFLETR